VVGAVTCDWLAISVERADEVPCRCRLTQQIRVDEAAGKQQSVVGVRVGIGDDVVDAHPAGRHVQVDSSCGFLYAVRAM
jgi:hypothetical protein